MIHVNPDPTNPRVLVVMGSTRHGRICPKVTSWVVDIARDIVTADYEIIDLSDWHLPMDDEPGVPAAGTYLNAHTVAWSRKVSEGDAVVFVTPQYNWGYPAALKNALDHLYREWRGKPAVIVTYGQRGGGKCAKQLRQVADGLHMRPIDVMPALRLPRALIEANDGSVAPDRHFASAAGQVRRAFGKLAAQLKVVRRTDRAEARTDA